MQRASPPSAGRARGQHLPLKGGGSNSSLHQGKGDGEGTSSARICLGAIAAAHGVRGLVKIKSFTADPHAIADYGPLQDESATRSFELELVSETKGVLIARIADVKDRNAAERLKGVRLYVRRVDLPEPAADEFYHADLVGLEALNGDGTPLGKVRAVYDFGGGPSLEIENEAGKMVLVPFTTAAVPAIDVAGGKLVVTPPAGLLDAPGRAEKV